nr:phosphatidylglycerophosphatase A [Salidesulfovibrio onnuriiensis]
MINKTALYIATLGPVGNLPKMPGTWGSLVSAAAAPWLFLPFSLPLRMALLGLVLILGAWAATEAEKALGKKDPGCVIIDELFGQWLTMLPFAALSPAHIAAAFILFRVFDIAKPWPIKRAETLFPKGFGVMIDDGIAGVFAGAILYFLLPFIP